MNRTCKSILTAVVMLAAWLSADAQRTGQMEDTQLFIVESVTEGNLYVGQPICYSVKLYSTNPSIGFARAVDSPDFSGLVPVRLPKARTGRNSGIQKETYKGKEYYTVVLDDVMLLASQGGSYAVRGAEYVIGINEYVLVSDPFWGTVRRVQPAEYPVKARDLKLKVKNLPAKAPQDFSGAVGEFSIKSILPEGPIAPGQEATVLFRIIGAGDLREIAVPDVTSAFPDNVELKSVSRNLQTWQQDDAVMSELTLECTFVPESEGDVVISPVSFVFFSTAKGKYVTSESEAVYFSAVRPALPQAPPVIHDV